MSIKKDENTKKTILFTVLAIILFLFGPFAVFLIVVAVIGCICYMVKKNGAEKDIFKNRDLSKYELRNKLVDNIVTTIRDNTKDVNITAKPYRQRARQQRYGTPQHRFEISSSGTPFEPKRRNYDPGNLVDMLEREKKENRYANPDVMSIKNPFEK